MTKIDNRYTLIRYIIDAPIVGIGYIVAVKSTLGQDQSQTPINSFLFTLLAMAVWYLAASFSRDWVKR